MKIESTDEARFDAALAHGLARVALGFNIAMHGYGRLPNLTGFANGMVKQFAFYAGLLATVRFDRFSLDGLRQRKWTSTFD